MQSKIIRRVAASVASLALVGGIFAVAPLSADAAAKKISNYSVTHVVSKASASRMDANGV